MDEVIEEFRNRGHSLPARRQQVRLTTVQIDKKYFIDVFRIKWIIICKIK